MGGLQGAGLPIAQESLGADKGRHRGIWNRPSGAAELVNPDADGRGWLSDEAKNPGAVVGAIRQLDHMTGTGYNSHLWRDKTLRTQKLKLV